MKHLFKLMLTLTILSASALSNEAKGQYGRTAIDLENIDYRLDVAGFYSQALLVGVSRDNYYSIKGTTVPIEHPVETLRNSSLLYQVDTLTSRRSETGILHPDLLTYMPVAWSSEPAAARLGSCDFECVKMAAAPDGSLVLVTAQAEVNEKAAEALKQLLTDKYGAPAYRESRSSEEQCRWQTDDEYIQLQIQDNEDTLTIEFFRWQKKNRDLIATYRPFLLNVFFEQSGSKYLPL